MRNLAAKVAVMVLGVTAPGVGWGAPYTMVNGRFSVPLKDLVMGKPVAFEVPAAGEYGVPGCDAGLRAAATTLEVARGPCNARYRSLGDFEISYEKGKLPVDVYVGDEGRLEYGFWSRSVKLGEKMDEVYVLKDTGWTLLATGVDKVVVPKEGVPAEAKLFSYVGDRTFLWSVAREAEEGFIDVCADEKPAEGVLVKVELGVNNRKVDIVDKNGAAASNILPPNTPITVCVSHAGTIQVTDVSLSGTRGLFQARVADESGMKAELAATDDRAPARPPSPGLVGVRLAPRKPGPADLTVTWREGSDGPDRPFKVAEFEIAESIAGVVRVGIGIGTVGDPSYEAVTAPGADQPEIVDTTYGIASPELVLGFAPFWLDAQGRMYEGPAAATRNRWAPYVGIGLVNVDTEGDTSLSLLQSLYLGMEYELIRSSSLAGAIMFRRVDRLAEPFQLGGPVTNTESIGTQGGFLVGVSLVFNVSPEFVEIAKNGAAKKE